VFRVSTQRELYLGLFDYSVDAAKTVGLRLGHCLKTAERVVEID
jgi:hypothetical protein